MASISGHRAPACREWPAPPPPVGVRRSWRIGVAAGCLFDSADRPPIGLEPDRPRANAVDLSACRGATPDTGRQAGWAIASPRHRRATTIYREIAPAGAPNVTLWSASLLLLPRRPALAGRSGSFDDQLEPGIGQRRVIGGYENHALRNPSIVRIFSGEMWLPIIACAWLQRGHGFSEGLTDANEPDH